MCLSSVGQNNKSGQCGTEDRSEILCVQNCVWTYIGRYILLYVGEDGAGLDEKVWRIFSNFFPTCLTNDTNELEKTVQKNILTK